MSDGRLRIGIIGCGNISGPYARSLAEFPHLELAGATDLDVSRADKFFGFRAQVPFEEGLRRTIEWYKQKHGMNR